MGPYTLYTYTFTFLLLCATQNNKILISLQLLLLFHCSICEPLQQNASVLRLCTAPRFCSVINRKRCRRQPIPVLFYFIVFYSVARVRTP